MTYMDMLNGDTRTSAPTQLRHTDSRTPIRTSAHRAFSLEAQDFEPTVPRDVMSCFRQDRYGKTR